MNGKQQIGCKDASHIHIYLSMENALFLIDKKGYEEIVLVHQKRTRAKRKKNQTKVNQ